MKIRFKAHLLDTEHFHVRVRHALGRFYFTNWLNKYLFIFNVQNFTLTILYISSFTKLIWLILCVPSLSFSYVCCIVTWNLYLWACIFWCVKFFCSVRLSWQQNLWLLSIKIFGGVLYVFTSSPAKNGEKNC